MDVEFNVPQLLRDELKASDVKLLDLLWHSKHLCQADYRDMDRTKEDLKLLEMHSVLTNTLYCPAVMDLARSGFSFRFIAWFLQIDRFQFGRKHLSLTERQVMDEFFRCAQPYGFKPEHLVHIRCDQKEWQRGSVYYFVLRQETRLTVVLRGSYTIGDAMTDLDAIPVPIKFGENLQETGYVHRGFMKQISIVFTELFQKRLFSEIDEIVFTGHSMGAALAAVAGVLFDTLKHNAANEKACREAFGDSISWEDGQLDTFANIKQHTSYSICPPCSMSINLCEYAKKFTVGLVCWADNVSRLSHYCVRQMIGKCKWVKDGNAAKDYKPTSPRSDDLFAPGRLVLAYRGGFWDATLYDFPTFLMCIPGLADHMCMDYVTEIFERNK